MVFPPAPAYLDPPNWNNQQGQQPRETGGGGEGDAQQQHTSVDPTAAPPGTGGMPSSSVPNEAVGAQQARPNSMTERARMARVPQPEPALKCPRCDSTNTKFCYYNNYSLSQPRHFCKACRRYWTRGGALRTVPVGGGCRRNKRSSKSSAASSSKASSSSARQLAGGASSTAASTTPGPTGALIPSGLSSMSHHLPFLGTMHPPGPNLGLAFSVGLPPLGMQQRQHMDGGVDQFPLASGGGATFGASLEQQWRVQQQQQQQPHQQQFPFMELPPAPAMYQLGLQASRAAGTSAAAPSPAMFTLGQTSATDEGSMKEADSKGQEMSLQRQYMEALRQGEGLWGGSATDNSGNASGNWTMNIHGFHSSSGSGDGGGLL